MTFYIKLIKGIKDFEEQQFNYYDTFNTTSVNFLFYICLFNDKEKGLILLKHFYSYLQSKQICYYYCLDYMFHPETIKNIIIWLDELDNNLSKDTKLKLLGEQLEINEKYYNKYNLYNLYYYIKHNVNRFLIKNRLYYNKNQLYLSSK